jgi:hypothetical protein
MFLNKYTFFSIIFYFNLKTITYILLSCDFYLKNVLQNKKTIKKK